ARALTAPAGSHTKKWPHSQTTNPVARSAASRLTRLGGSDRCIGMPICKGCGEEVEELVTVKVQGKSKKLCEDCAGSSPEQEAVAQESEAVVQNMMGFKGRR